jgi:hypothetical protein
MGEGNGDAIGAVVRGLRRERGLVLAASFLTFLLSANIAWLNPSPEFEVYRTGPIPVLWQYNPDAGVELVSAAWFPEAYRTYPERIGRPVYPAIVRVISDAVESVAGPVRPLTRIEAAGVAYAGFKLATVVLAGQLAFGVLRRRLGREEAVLGSVLMLLHWHMVEYAAAFHTTDLQLTATVAVLWLAMVVAERAEARDRIQPGRSDRRLLGETFLAGLAVGTLLLAKQTLVAPLAVLAVLILGRRFLVAAIAVAAAGLPTLAYLALLRTQGIRYVSWEVEEYGQGRWVLEAWSQPGSLLAEIIDALGAFPLDALRFYGPILPLAAAGLMLGGRRWLKPSDARWIALAVVAAFFQYLGVQRKIPYMTADFGIVVFGAAAVALVALRHRLLSRQGERGFGRRLLGERPLLAMVVGGSIVSAVLNLGNLPWVPPSEQPTRDPAVLANRVDILERPEAYSEDARERARDGRIIAPDIGPAED